MLLRRSAEAVATGDVPSWASVVHDAGVNDSQNVRFTAAVRAPEAGDPPGIELATAVREALNARWHVDDVDLWRGAWCVRKQGREKSDVILGITALATAEYSPVYTRVAPNGERCGPVCDVASEDLVIE